MRHLDAELQSNWIMQEISIWSQKVWTGTFSQEHKKQFLSFAQLLK